VISPFALATAYFSMPQAIVPFKMNVKSFLVVNVVIMVVVRLLSMVLRGPLQQSWLWICITEWIKTLPWDANISLRKWRRGRNVPDISTEGTEMRVLEV